MAMLSSEKSLAYWERLRIPLVRSEYEKTNLYARGALELIFYPDVIKESQIYDFQESWKNYRTSGSVLSDEFLQNHPLNTTGWIDDEKIKSVFQALNVRFKFEKGGDLYKWAIKYFRDSSDSILEAAARITFLLDKLKEGSDEYSQNIKLPEEQFDRIKKFCNHVKWRNDRLNRHFSVAYEVHEMTLPNQWEMVLQDYFSEGYRSSYWWMRSVEYSLQYIGFYQRWQELKNDVGNETINLLINLLEETLNKLPEPFWLLKQEDLERLKKL